MSRIVALGGRIKKEREGRRREGREISEPTSIHNVFESLLLPARHRDRSRERPVRLFLQR